VKLTNKFNLPATILNVIARPNYDKGKANFSVTELLTSPRIVQLKRKHWNELEEDASDMVWSLFGSAIHGVLEHGKGDNHIVEERIHLEIDGTHISGAIDLQEVEEDGIILSDYKTTSAWVVQNMKQDWHDQLNIYAYLVEKAKGKPVKKLQIVAIVRDWARRDAEKEGYPQAPIVVIDIPLWAIDEREAFIKTRINQHKSAVLDMEIDELTECTPEDMWLKETSYAVKKEGGVRAKSVHKTREEAEAALTKGYFLEVREGERTRCQSFCQVAPFCEQWKQYKETK
jgi:hypothetical protein